MSVRASSRAWAAALALVAGHTAPLNAQQPQPLPPPSAERLKSQKDELDRIRSERSRLEARQRELRSTVHDLSEERVNIERQAATTARLVKSLDQQLVALADEEGTATADLIRAQDELAVKRSVLRHRVREIYKRGALYSTEALLAAQSFGDPEINTRIAQYEMAFRMQTSVPELTDIASEPRHIRDGSRQDRRRRRLQFADAH